MPPRANDNEATDTATEPVSMIDYETRLLAVTQLKEMTDTAAWQRMHTTIQSTIQRHAREVLEAEGNRAVISHQQGVKVLRKLLREIQTPIDELNHYIHDMPLMASQMPTRARWNEELGKVEMFRV